MRNFLGLIAVVLVFAVPARAQTMGEYAGIERGAGTDVVVRDERGVNVRGRLVGISGDELRLTTGGGARWIPLSRVVRVTQPGDPLTNGAFRGAMTATAWCVLMTCGRDNDGNVHGASFVGHVALGALIGGAIDKSFNRGRTIYVRRPGPTIHIGAGPRGGSVTIGF